MKNKFIPLLLSIFSLFISCGNKKVNNQKIAVDTCYLPQYAKGFRIEKSGDTKILRVFNPWQGATGVEFTYYLKPDADPKKMDEIKTPVQRIICLSSTHIAFIDVLGHTAEIYGVSGAPYITNSIIQQGIANKRVRDVGYEASLSYEQVVTTRPDVVFAYGVSGELASVATKLNELGVKVVFLGDYLEETPLGKTEWVLALSAFFNEETQAAEKFSSICNDYLALKAKVQTQSTKHPIVMLNAPWKDSWFVPGGNGYMTNMLKDAGADFIFADNDKRDSYPISIELAYSKTLTADYWLNPNAAQSLDDLKEMDVRMAQIPAFKNGRVYNNNARMTAGGGSDFWESGVVAPHIILKDLVKIFYPQLVPEHELVYYHQLR